MQLSTPHKTIRKNKLQTFSVASIRIWDAEERRPGRDEKDGKPPRHGLLLDGGRCTRNQRRTSAFGARKDGGNDEKCVERDVTEKERNVRSVVHANMQGLVT